MKIGFSENFCNLKIFFKHFSINPIAKWTYGQNIENCATPPLKSDSHPDGLFPHSLRRQTNAMWGFIILSFIP
jgi:hypothetical protein